MKRNLLFACLAFGLVLALAAGNVWAHGGQFRGPNGGIPPGGRDPFDPEPPPPPPSDPDTPRGPETPGEPPEGPTTPHDNGQTPRDTAPPDSNPLPKGNDRRGGPKTPTLTFESWRYWWAYNNADILNIKTHIYSKGLVSSDPRYYASGADKQNRISVMRPTIYAIENKILPSLHRSIDRRGEHDDIVGGALVAMGKVGSQKHIKTFDAILSQTYRSDKGRRLKFGYQAKESAALALGLLPQLDANEKAIVRRVCLDAIVNEKLNRRDRVWAAVSLGLQRDREAVQPLVELLDKRHRYVDDNIPAGILVALGLIGDEAVRADLEAAFVEGRLFGRDIRNNDRLRAFAAGAIAQLGNSESLPRIQAVLRSRSYSKLIKRSAAIAAGVLGAKADDEMKKKTVASLLHYMRRTGDPSGLNFATVALSQVGTNKAMRALLEIVENGKYGQRSFAALALGTHIWYAARAAERKEAAPMDRTMRERIVNKLRKLSERFKDSDTRAAFMLARGLARDKTAVEELVRLAAKRNTAPVLRGYCCVALGLIGDARQDVKDALGAALAKRSDPDLRSAAATGLGLLRDQKVIKTLLSALKKAKSFAVQGQLIMAIGTVGDSTAIGPLIELLDDRSQPDQTRAMAAVGLGMIGDLRKLPALSRLSKNYNYRASVKDIDELLFIL